MQLTIYSQVKALCNLSPRYGRLPANLADQSNDDATIIHADDKFLSVIEHTHLIKQLLFYKVAVLLNYLEIIRS